MRKLSQYWTSAIAVSLIVFTVVYFRVWAQRLCCGGFIYPIDDTYIHIAMAKNLALHGVWGIEPSAPAFCSSSPLWTVILAGFYSLFGVNEILPWYLTLGCNICIAVFADHLMVNHSIKWYFRLPAILVISLAAPFFCTTALAMEHAMHGMFLLTTVCFLAYGKDGWRGIALVSALAFCATATRYESLFFLLPFCLLLVCFRRWRVSVVMLSAILPVLIYGSWAIAKGGHFLPNSLLLKGQFMSITDVIVKTLSLFVSIPEYCHYLYLLVIPLVIALLLPGVRAFWRIASAGVLVSIAGQMVFAQVLPILWRYDAYLMTLGSTVAILALISAFKRHIAWNVLHAVAVLVMTVAVCVRAWDVVIPTVWSSEDIFSQQVIMTKMMSFLPDSAKGCVAINDLGYTSLNIEAPVLDLWGLGSQDVAEERIKAHGDWSTEQIAAAFKRHSVRYMVVYETWFPIEGMPRNTIPVAYLDLENPYICGSNRVSFRAFTKEDAEMLSKHLSQFVEHLPRRASFKFLLNTSKPLCAL